MRRGLRDIGALPMQFRSTVVTPRAAAEGEPRVYDFSISSEVEVERWWGIEILSHDAGAIDMTRMQNGMPILVEHGGEPVGVVLRDSGKVVDRRLNAAGKFSRSQRGQEIEQDVIDEVRSNTSAGYFVKEATLVEVRNGVEVWRVTRWQPAEVSIVGIPADTTVGFGRSQGGDNEPLHPVHVIAGGGTMKKKVRNEAGEVIEVDASDPRPAIDEGARGADGGGSTTTRAASPAPVTVDATATERARADEIRRVCQAHNIDDDQADSFVRSTLTHEQVAARILASKRTTGAAQPGAEGLDIKAKDAKRYSYCRALLQAARVAVGQNVDGIEGELHVELQRKMQGLPVSGNGILIPWQFARGGDDPAVVKRALDSKTGGKGAEAVFDAYGGLIELLRNKAAAIRLGARVLSGLTQPVSFVRQTGAGTAYWVGENPPADVTASDLSLGTLTLSPKTLQSTTSWSRQLLVQASPDTEQMVQDDLATINALAIDRSVFHGLGANGEPAGIYKTTGVGTKAFGGAATYALLLAMQGIVASANADLGSLGFAMHPTMATNLRGIPKFSNTATPVWEGDYLNGNCAGYPAVASNQLSNQMSTNEATGGSELGTVFGNWADCLIAQFLGFEVIVDPFALKKRGMVEATSIQMADVGFRHPESFVKSTGATG